ncbi:MAG: T9SS type A sorting domain-containing protein [Bacteroidia bacterium]
MKKKFILFITLVFCKAFYAQPVRIYVDNTATSPTPDGSTWQTAYINLQDAFNDISVSGSDTIEIWVRATNTPYKPVPNPQPQDGYFNIPGVNKHIYLYGGFNGTETTLNQRPSNAHSVLSGDVGVPGDSSDNTRCLIRIEDPTSMNNTKVLIDGFVFQDVNYDGTGSTRGALFIHRDFVTINNCIFKNNRTSDRGAAISTIKAIVITNSIFENNTANLYGGAIDIYLFSPLACFILNCKFFNNVALTGIGGAIKADYVPNLYLVNSLFVNNTGANGSAAQSFNSNISAVNCTFVKSNGSIFEGASNNTHYIVNSIIYKSSSTNILSGNGQLFLSHSLYENGSMTGYTSSGNNYIADPKFKYYNDSLLDQSVFELQSCSPGINEGNNTNINYFINLGAINGDIQGKERLRDSIVDIGAYEYFKDTLIVTNDSLRLQASSIYWLQQSGINDSILIDSVYLYNCTTNQTVMSMPLSTFNGSVSPTVTGNYAFIFTYNGGCSDTTECKSITITPNTNGQNEIILSNTILVYPNPAQNQLTIAGIVKETNYQIFDIAGKILLSGKIKSLNEIIDVSTLNSGIYFLEIDNQSTSKIIITK